MVRKYELPQFLRNLKILPSGQMSFFLGSGASVQAGIPSGSALVWEFKKEIYCSETETSYERFRDLQMEKNRLMLQEYFDGQGNNPALYDLTEYSHYFEKCYSSSNLREQFIINLVKNIKPSLGHNCLGDLIIKGKIKTVWTTNFDELIEAGIKQIDPAFSFRVLSYANRSGFSETDHQDFPDIYKLHGDYRYDKIKNTLEELQTLELKMSNRFETSLKTGGLIMIGYSGCDESIMSILEKNVETPDFLPNGLIWVRRKKSELPARTMKLMEYTCVKNKNSGIVDIDGFDEFMYSYYKICSGDNQLINDRWKDFEKRQLPITFSAPKANYFIKMNVFESVSYPEPVSFDTDIITWKDLREAIGENKIIAGLYARRVYCFASLEKICSVFKKHILSDLKKEAVAPKYLYRNTSFYISMLYELIEVSLLSRNNITKIGKNLYYDSSRYETFSDNDGMYHVYDGFEICLEFISGKYYLCILLTVYITDINGDSVSKERKKLLVNKKMSSMYNQSYDEKIKLWNKILKTPDARTIEFCHDNFSFKFNYACVSYGTLSDNMNLPQKTARQFDEPIMLFDINNSNIKGIHQLKGILNHGPIDFSYAKKDQYRYSIKLSIIAPCADLAKIVNHLNKLNNRCRMIKEDGFIPEYNGFEQIYRQGLDIPQLDNPTRCLTYDRNRIINREFLVETIKRKIDFLSIESNDFSILVIYFPKVFEQFRLGSIDEDFNLHDSIKLYAMDKNIRVQIIEEKSLATNEPCKVMWALSASIYAKHGGILWRAETLDTKSAFVGVSYALSKEKGISVGCSQLFDSTGTGLRLLLKKIKNPQFIQKNPFMKADEARQMMSELRNQYYQSCPTSKLNRIVIHKTTFFTQEEIQGFTQALEGIEDIELLQIQEFSPWRGIRFKNINSKNGVYNFPMKRGTVIELSNNQFLLWTHGCVISNELFDGKGYNYYKGGRGIPKPLMIRRYYGKASGDVIAKEIMMLTKMNWNSADSLYKNLPVTLDFAKILSRMSKQNEALYDKLYDFRYFM